MSKTSKIDLYIGNKIRERRKQLKLSQQELASILGISYQQLQKYESGNTPLTMARLFQIAHALNVNVQFFHDGAPTDDDIGEKIKSDIIVSDRTKPLNVLLVEDSNSDEMLFRKAVSVCGEEVSVESINDSEKVIDYLCNCESKFGKENPDIIMLDINMPKTDGMEVLKQIKKNPSISHIPVIMLTNSVRTTDMEKCYRLQASSFIQKSVDFDEFCKVICSTIKYWSTATVLPSMAS